ncbi:MAG TPA: hypothetical protein PLL76_20420 [Thermoanaerobaculia bacterium]|nr:hypothetical protein [Thermoanaerobaculia bacterium]
MNMPRISKEHAAVLRREVDDYLAVRGRTEAPPRSRPAAPPPADPVREEVRAAIAGAGDADEGGGLFGRLTGRNSLR